MSVPITLELFVGFLIMALVFVPLERWLPIHPLHAFRPGWKLDVSYYAVMCFLGHFSDALSFGALLLLRWTSGLSLDHVAAGQPGWLQFLEILLVSDFGGYWAHRSMHRFPLLWRFHKIHHSSELMDWLANVRLHPVDKVIGDCAQFIPVFCLGFGDGPLLAFTIFLGFQGFLIHSNVNLHFGPLRWLFVSPAFHHWHHSNAARDYDKNFAPYLVIFDRLFGTANFAPPRAMPEKYGLDEALPQNFWGQMFHPFRRATRV